MDKIYLVLAIKNNTEVVSHELFLDQDLALKRGYDVAMGIIDNDIVVAWVINNPTKENLDDNTDRWVFLETSNRYVGVHLLPINSNDIAKMPNLFIPNQTNTTAVGGDKYDYPKINLLSINDRSALNTPGGFSIYDKPIDIGYLISFPKNVKSTGELTDNQRFALVIARVNSIPNYNFTWASGLVWTRDHVLYILRNQGKYASQIIDFETSFLDDLRKNKIKEYDYEEESSSSSEDEW